MLVKSASSTNKSTKSYEKYPESYKAKMSYGDYSKDNFTCFRFAIFNFLHLRQKLI